MYIYKKGLQPHGCHFGYGEGVGLEREPFTVGAPSDEQIWNSIRDRDVSRSIRDYFWRSLHGSYKCRAHWLNIPGYEHWATCHDCHVDESMEHILVECTASGQDLIWRLCGQLWEKKFQKMPEMTLGLILGCGIAEFNNSKGKKMPHASRLFRIMVSESAYLIWKVRNERVIGGRKHTETEIHNRWVSCMNMRLKMDQLLTDRSRYASLRYKESPTHVGRCPNGQRKPAR